MSLDRALFRLINGDWGWDALAPFMRFMSTLEYFLPLIVILVAWMLVKNGLHGRVTVIALLVLVPLTDQVSSHLLKPMIGRPRPCRPESGLADVKTHGAYCSGKGSFPSSHASNMGGVAVLLGLRYRRWAIPAGLVGFLVGYSRVFLGVHYPSDVLGGWMLGSALGTLVAWGASRLETWWSTRKRLGIR